ncbi:hypothetical protein E2C01_002279 [Portunus trituberculatus]|uniref:Uncharacterized protein n=1 Tax=Portunus trituberculatus TaxID=210409 RepID=A0A5B7CIZ5_PORTR|nr:hypothetical protein [Portunus trituberculatus]
MSSGAEGKDVCCQKMFQVMRLVIFSCHTSLCPARLVLRGSSSSSSENHVSLKSREHLGIRRAGNEIIHLEEHSWQEVEAAPRNEPRVTGRDRGRRGGEMPPPRTPPMARQTGR